MWLYNTTLTPSGAIHQAVVGNFSGTKQQEILLVHTTHLELLQPDPSTGKLHTLLTWPTFSHVFAVTPFRLTGATKDHIVVGSDSGRICVLEYNPKKRTFDRIHLETYGKSGCRRIVPGPYLVHDPKGRAIMIGAMEKMKLVYVMNRDASNQLTISSPLEAHKSRTVCHALVAVDVGYENPVFAALEVDYGEAEEDPTGEALGQMEKVSGHPAYFIISIQTVLWH
jgi:splicing factor 3B subunit 3